MRKRGVEWTINEQRRKGIPYYIIYIGRGAMKNEKRKTENGKLIR